MTTRTEIMIVGEAWGREEEEAGRPFVGASGRVLNGMLAQAGINRKECHLTNVFNLRPQPSNDVKNLCGPRDEGIPGMPALSSSKYVLRQYAPELERLYREVEHHKPNVIIAMGATPSWALLRTTGIKAIRGAPDFSERTKTKVLPTYHPAAVMRDWRLRPVVLADLAKAKREAQFPEVRRPKREVWIKPTIPDLYHFYGLYIAGSPDLAIDIETKGRIITCIGFAPYPSVALVIPFFDETKEGCNYWHTFEEEREAWLFVAHMCEQRKRIVFQNGLYDMNFLWTEMGIRVPFASDDTMLLHHALQPEMEKGLGFLGTIYTDEASWKFMRKSDTVKRED